MDETLRVYDCFVSGLPFRKYQEVEDTYFLRPGDQFDWCTRIGATAFFALGVWRASHYVRHLQLNPGAGTVLFIGVLFVRLTAEYAKFEGGNHQQSLLWEARKFSGIKSFSPRSNRHEKNEQALEEMSQLAIRSLISGVIYYTVFRFTRACVKEAKLGHIGKAFLCSSAVGFGLLPFWQAYAYNKF